MKLLLLVLLTLILSTPYAQWVKSDIHSDFVLQSRREKFENYLLNNTIKATFDGDLTEDTEFDFESSCLSAIQFQIQTPDVAHGINKMVASYNTLSVSAKRALLSNIYSNYPTTYNDVMEQLIAKEKDPKLFDIEALYLFRNRPFLSTVKQVIKTMQLQLPGQDTLPLLTELRKYLFTHNRLRKSTTPSLHDLFTWQKDSQIKAIYSFQRWDRDYAGLAVVQYEDGHFARDKNGRLLCFQQLARAGSNLPYFITGGNTPQGVYSINGTDVSRNQLIGPTPNLQTLLPFENDSSYWFVDYDSSVNELSNYLSLLPPSWRDYTPMTEAFYAGKVGRSAIIVHGTTIDPVYFKTKTYYPLTPTDGCLCAKELWDPQTGGLIESDQLQLVNTFMATADKRGFLYVINLSDDKKPVTRQELEQLIGRM